MMEFPNPKFLFYIAMADAFGMGVEYLKLDRAEDYAALTEVLKFNHYVAHPRYGSGAARYTDDTEMSVANTHVLLEKDSGFTKRDFANAYVNEFEFGGRRKGYSKGFQVVLEKVKTGEELLTTVVPNSEKNGAAMRSVPFGVLRDISSVLEASTVSASVTHDTAIGHFSARAVALASHFSLYEQTELRKLREYILAHLPKEDYKFAHIISEPWTGAPVTGNDTMGPVGLTTVNAVLSLLTTQMSLVAMLDLACCWGGDVDSVASITWGIASARFQDSTLPEFLIRDLEWGSPKTGELRLCQLGTQLMNKYRD